MFDQSESQKVYDHLWTDALAAFRRGEIQVDPYLQEREADRRRGLTLLARPGAEAAGLFLEVVETLRRLEPDQHFYRPDEFHVTVLTLVSSSDRFDLSRAPLAAYRTVFAGLFKRFHRFTIRFDGITVSPGAVLVRGYVARDYLNRMREAIREALQQAGLARSLDTRYRIVTAHATLMRFGSPLRQPDRFLARLAAIRNCPLGATEVKQIDFVVNDWYMSHDRVRVLAAYPLNRNQGSGIRAAYPAPIPDSCK